MKTVVVDKGVAFGGGKLVFIAGPCVIESRRMALDLAARLSAIARKLGAGYVFKASFDKANRTSVDSFRGPGIEKGLEILSEIRSKYDVPVVTDVHEPWQCRVAAEVCDILQIPAFLARQTDLLVAAGETGAVVNVKKGQFMAPEDMAQVVRKIESTGNRRILLCERGSSFGYRNLVADMRSLPIMRSLGYPVVMDATHSGCDGWQIKEQGPFTLEEGEDMWVPEGEPLLLGDIVISLPRAAAQAEEFGHSLRREAVFLFVHGMLHLLGYDHMEPEDEQEMMALQNQVMDKLGISR
jgi:2-dehydro-3-deoxyphosphooctonate aldolase (KDO 8-P synthase)